MFGGGLFGSGDAGGGGVNIPPPSSNNNNNNGGGGGGGRGGANGLQGFDPTGLERAAKAAKELDKSKNSHRAFELAKYSEQTKQAEEKAKMKEYEAKARQFELEVVGRKANEERKTLQQKNEQSKQIADYKDGLDRKRIKDKLEAEQFYRQQERDAEQQKYEKLEAIKRKTLEHEVRNGIEMSCYAANTSAVSAI